MSKNFKLGVNNYYLKNTPKDITFKEIKMFKTQEKFPEC